MDRGDDVVSALDRLNEEMEQYAKQQRAARLWAALALFLWILMLILVASLATRAFAADPFPTIEGCEGVAPWPGVAAAVVLWHHRNPDDPSRYWEWYTGTSPVPAGARVEVNPEGHPAFIVIGFQEAAIPSRYYEVRCGQHPSVIFQDGFESGGTVAWSEAVNAAGKHGR